MRKQLFFSWMIGLLLLCFNTVYAQSAQKPSMPTSVKALILEHKLDLKQQGDVQKLQSLSSYLKNQYGSKGGQLVYLYEAKSYACLDRSPNAAFLTQVKQDVSAKFGFITFKEVNEQEFIAKYPMEWQTFESNGAPVINDPNSVVLKGDPRAKAYTPTGNPNVKCNK